MEAHHPMAPQLTPHEPHTICHRVAEQIVLNAKAAGGSIQTPEEYIARLHTVPLCPLHPVPSAH